MNNVKFTKMHGLGNDFVIIDTTNQIIEINSTIAQFICDRKTGIGCDQLLIINQINKSSDYQYRIFNSDGNESENCGNGARCIVKYIYTYKNFNLNNNVTLYTKNRIITGNISVVNDMVTVSMGVPLFAPDEIPFIHKHNPNNSYELKLHNTFVQFGVVSIGNPHVIIEVYSQESLLDYKSLEKLALLLQNSEYFPNSVNVNFYFKLNQNEIQLVTYERGCGFTNSCGTGACATAAYGILQNYWNSKVNILMPGGRVIIEWNKKDQLIMTGDAQEVFNGSIML